MTRYRLVWILLAAISTCICRHERLEAIQKARETFDHDVQSIHDDEMASGADAALAKHLTFLVYHSRCDNDPMLSEISLTVDVMEALYRASSEIVEVSFRRMGKEVLEILVNLIDEELGRRVDVIPEVRLKKDPDEEAAKKDDEKKKKMVGESSTRSEHESGRDSKSPQNAENDGTVDEGDEVGSMSSSSQPRMLTRVREGTFEGDRLLRKAVKLIGHFARAGKNTTGIAHFPGLLGSFIRLITVQPYECIPWEARLSALWVMANVACSPDNMQMMVCTPGLIGSLVEIASRPLHPGDDLEVIIEVLRSRANASKAIMNLSWSPENKIVLAEQTAVIDLLGELSVHRVAPLQQSRTVQEILAKTRFHAVTALRHLAGAPRRTKIALCEYKKGHLLDVLTDAALNDRDPMVKDAAYGAIHHLAIQDTALQIVNHPALVLALRSVLMSDDANPKSHASATLMVLERTITPEMESYEVLRDLLDAVNPTNTTSDENDSEMEVVHATEV